MGGLVLGLLMFAPSSPPPSSKAVLQLLKQVPAFARRKPTVLKTEPIQDRPGYHVEVQWREGKTVRLAVAVLLEVARATPPPAWLARDAAFGVAELHEDRTLAGLLAAQQRARAAAAEQAVIADLRAFAAAQAAYQAVNAGFFGEPSCLRSPWDCIPKYTREQMAFLAPDATVDGEKASYVRRFHRGPEGATTVVPRAPATTGRRGAAASPPTPLEYTGLTAYALTAVPLAERPSGARRFCVDARGRVCAVPGPGAPEVVDATCPEACQPVE
jgi:hypothetical protein